MQSLEFLLTKSEIEQRYIRYCELIDHGKQFDRMGEVFTADTVGEYAQAIAETRSTTSAISASR